MKTILITLGSKEYHNYMVILGESITKYYPEIYPIFYIVDDIEAQSKELLQKYGEIRYLEHDTNISKPLFCATRRAYLIPELRAEFPADSIMWVDADSVFRRRDEALLTFLQNTSVSMRPKNLKEGKFASGVIVSGPQSSNFFETYLNFVSREIGSGRWMTDQECLNKTYQFCKSRMNDFGYKPLPNKYCDVWFSDDGVLWTAKGDFSRMNMYNILSAESVSQKT